MGVSFGLEQRVVCARLRRIVYHTLAGLLTSGDSRNIFTPISWVAEFPRSTGDDFSLLKERKTAMKTRSYFYCGLTTTLNIILYFLTIGNFLWLEGRVRRGYFRNWLRRLGYRPPQFEM